MKITINLESHGRLEYNQDNQNSPDIVITEKDLTTLSNSITQYERNVRKQLLESFQTLGVNFNNSNKAVLASSGKSYEELTVGQLTTGLQELPRSLCQSSNKHVGIKVTGNDSAITADNVARVSGNVMYKLCIPKGWRDKEVLIDLSDIYKQAGLAWQNTTFQNSHAKKVYHVHSLTSDHDTIELGYNIPTPSPMYPDGYLTPEPTGCFTTPVYHTHIKDAWELGGCYMSCYTRYGALWASSDQSCGYCGHGDRGKPSTSDHPCYCIGKHSDAYWWDHTLDPWDYLWGLKCTKPLDVPIGYACSCGYTSYQLLHVRLDF